MTQPQPIPLSDRTRSNPFNAELALALLGPSPAMSQLWAQMRRLSPHLRTVLLTGEPDCGQDAVARLLLDLSPQPHRPFVLLTAAEAEARLRAFGVNSLPSDVFLFLPDIQRFSAAAQESLLHLLQLRRARPFTIVASAQEDLRALVGVGRFSPALAEALSSVRLAVPCLKQRVEDIPMLVSHTFGLKAQAAGKPAPQLTEDFLRAAMLHSWPGNLRELTRSLSWLATECPDLADLSKADLHRAISAQHRTRTAELPPVRLVPLDSVVNEHICAVLRACRGNKLRASEILGISRSTLYRMLEAAAVSQGSSLPIAS